MITICYITSRPNPAIKWFFDSLRNECQNNWDGLRVVIVDFWCQEMPDLQWDRTQVEQRNQLFRQQCSASDYIHCPPKPTVWQGKYKITPKHMFDAGNSRNTGVCLAPDGYIVFVDDCSVLKPGWLRQVKMHEKNGTIGCGTFTKVKKLKVENGGVVSFESFGPGMDSRMRSVTTLIAKPCPPEWAFGCSIAIPVEALLKINGQSESMCGGMGYEDGVCGMLMSKHGYQLMFDPNMATLEDEDLHHNQFVLLRIDPGRSPADKSHAMLAISRVIDHFENDFGEGFPHIRDLRNHVLKGGEFPVRHNPRHDWFTKTPLEKFGL